MVRESYISMEHWWNNADKRNGITLKNMCASANLSTTNLTPLFTEAGFLRPGNMTRSIATLR
jgi:hypothetical protein